MGLFGIAEILNTVMTTYVSPLVHKVRLKDLYPTREEIRRSISPGLRGSVLGFFVGLLPGPSSVIATFVSYSFEKRISKHPEKFGTGMIEGVVAPEAANNSACMGAMIPLLTLGIPFNAPSAILLAGLRMHQVEPGPLLFQQAPEVFWTLIAAMYIGNLMLLVLNLPLVGLFAKIATIKPKLLMPVITIICLVGIYGVRNSFLDVWVMIASGIIGFVILKWKYPVAPLIIGIILGPMTESNLRKSLMMFHGDLSQISARPIAVVFLSLSLIFILYKMRRLLFRRREVNPVS
jgi:putative tricarboxylic transport membrane protein